MAFEQTAVRRNPDKFSDYGRTLKVAVSEPDFNNTKVFFGRNGYAIYVR